MWEITQGWFRLKKNQSFTKYQQQITWLKNMFNHKHETTIIAAIFSSYMLYLIIMSPLKYTHVALYFSPSKIVGVGSKDISCIVASSYRGQNHSTACFDCWPKCAHSGIFHRVFYCHFDHPEQYQTMLLPFKNGRLILTLNIHVRFDSVWLMH